MFGKGKCWKAIYNFSMSSKPDSVEYRLELLSRCGELIAWGSTLLVAAAWLFLGFSNQPIAWVVPALTILLFVVAVGISFSNWMDRKTLIRIDDQGIHYENGLRQAEISWQQIRQVRTYPSPVGKKVVVIGPHSAFQFRVLHQVRVQGELKGQMGFPEGETILQKILDQGNLQKIESGQESRAVSPTTYIPRQR